MQVRPEHFSSLCTLGRVAKTGIRGENHQLQPRRFHPEINTSMKILEGR
jgi:hypothetical protein